MVSKNNAVTSAGVGIAMILAASGCATNHEQICGTHVRFQYHKDQGIDFNGNEKLLVCGDPKTESWKQIPLSQSEFSLRQFLRNRAYFDPTFALDKDSSQGEALVVDPGQLVRSTRIDFVGAPTDFDRVVFRKVIGEPLNSELLDRIQADTIARLKLLGYACPDVDLNAIQETGVITATIRSGSKYVFENPKLKDALGIYPEVYTRFQAFREGQEFTYPWIQLTQSRAELDGIVVSSLISYQCPLGEGSTHEFASTPAHLDPEQQVIGGAPRLLSIGAGASTEEIPIFQIKWKSVRLDQFGSSLLASIYLSHRDQKAQFTYSDYIFRYVPRLSINPTFTFEHRNEPTYESSEFQVSSPLTYKSDYDTFALTTSIGPALSRVYSTTYGVDLADTYLSIIADLSLMSHEYELYQADPRSGTFLTLNIESLSPGTSFHPIATDIKFRGTHLIKLNAVEPHQWVFGVRYGFSTTLTSIRPEATSSLPAQYYQVLGGDNDLRGFGRYELNNGTIGALSSGFMGAEIRFAKTLPVWMEPFAFFDVGSLGQNVFALDGPLYTSPGLGLRLSTPFGAVRSTFAHGFVSNTGTGRDELSHFQFFLSFGKEF